MPRYVDKINPANHIEVNVFGRNYGENQVRIEYYYKGYCQGCTILDQGQMKSLIEYLSNYVEEY